MNRAELLDDGEESLRLAMDNALSGLWVAMPGIIQGVDLGKQTCSVQPAIKDPVRDKDGKPGSNTLPLLVDVPLVFPRGGGFALTFPVRQGDECLVIFASRCIDAWWQSGGVQEAAEWRFGDLSDGFAILAPTSQPKALGGVSGSTVQLRSDDGGTFVEIAGGNVVKIKGSSVSIDAGDVSISGALTVSGDINVGGSLSGSGGLSIGGGMDISGDLHADGNVSFAALEVAGVDMGTHVHRESGNITYGPRNP